MTLESGALGSLEYSGSLRNWGTRTRGSGFTGEARMRQLLAENVVLEKTLHELRLGIDSHSIVAITDRRGTIIEANERFAELSKYSHEELIGAPQSIVNSGAHPKEFFREMWRVIGRGGIWQGEICNRAKDGTKYWVATTIVPLLDETGRPERYLSIRTDVTGLHKAEARVRRLAFTDSLTGLPNRAAIIRHLDGAARRPGPDHRGFLMLSFEDLPLINDVFGFDIGDGVLRRIAQVLTDLQEVPEGTAALDVAPAAVSRVGADDFGIDFAGLGDDPEAAEQRLLDLIGPLSERLNTVARVDLGALVEADLRFGYVIYSAESDLDGAAIFTRAEIARRRAASAPGEILPRRFEDRMISGAQERVNVLFRLRRAIADGDLRLFLQPIMGAGRELVGFEGLIRWQDPERGLISPGEFIPLAESTGLIIDIGSWVLDEACRLLAGWADDPRTAHLTISVNVSEHQLRRSDFVETVRGAVRRRGANPELLKLELTETMVHHDIDRTVRMLDELRAERIQASLDDFGTGYSSLSYLKCLPVQQLKIDREFVATVAEGPLAAAMVRTMVELAHLMELHVVAEGVETETQYETLREIGVDAFQGFLFGRPAAPAESAFLG